MTNEELVSTIQKMSSGNMPKLPLTSLEDSARFILFLLDSELPDTEKKMLIGRYAHLLYFSFDEEAQSRQPEYYKFAERFKFNGNLAGIFVAGQIPPEHWSDLLTDVLKYYRECALNNEGPDNKSKPYLELSARAVSRRRELRNKGFLILDDPDLGR